MADTGSSSPPVELVVGDRTVRISHLDRVYFPARGETKLDLARYYLSVGHGIVRAVRDRPCMMHRFPEGVGGEKVHQKRLPRGAPDWVETVRVGFPRYNRHADELCVTELASVTCTRVSTTRHTRWRPCSGGRSATSERALPIRATPISTGGTKTSEDRAFSTAAGPAAGVVSTVPAWFVGRRGWDRQKLGEPMAPLAQPAEPADQSFGFDHLLELFQEVTSARAAMTVARRAPLGRSRLVDAPRTRLLLALEAYVAELNLRNLPVPYGIRDDLRIQRRILGRVADAPG